ncbi:putative MerR family transcriptional regulator [Gordonia sputi NBRC 100414]|uniref:Putative MerR family transcriptional regulator n=2 Tax=Gordonia sputi TaxID=36823 RepID=H5U5R8_9ACTN|nr:MerR family transcriptional regulator [Gordonia sputi]GAB41076.1 putative MerR family transcriptional regulator [Gordonia sputi NBRC 100414]
MLIGEVSRHSGVSVRMLRHYDRLGLVRPATRTAGGYRDYSPDDIARLFRVVGLRALGVPLAGIKTLLDTPGTAEPADMVDELIAQTRQRLSRETELLTLLTRIADAAPTDWEDVLNSVKLLHDLDSDSAALRQRAALTAHDGRLSPEALAKAVLAEPDTNVAGTLVWALANSADPAAEAALATGLDSADPEIRRRAVSAITKLSTDTSVELLRRALHDSDRAVADAASLALALRGDTAMLPRLIDMVVDGGHDVDAADAIRDLAHTSATADEIATELGRLLDSDHVDPQARSRLAQALVDLPGEVAAHILDAHTDDRDPAVAALATLRQHRS